MSVPAPRTASVEQIRPGVWSIPVPIPNNPLGWTLVYAFDTPKGPVLVDAGWESGPSWYALVTGLAAAGFDVSDCYGVLVTHLHPDHHGLSARVRAASGAWIAMHAEDAMVLTRQPDAREWLMHATSLFLEVGASDADLAALPKPEDLPLIELARPDRLIADGEPMDVPGRELVAVWTPGHSPGHTCFYDRAERLMLCGDHVLPRISPHVGVYDEVTAMDDPLGSFLSSLHKLMSFETSLALPAHEQRFDDLHGRIEQILGHHRVRLEQVLDRLREGPATTWEITRSLPWNRSWDSLPGFLRRLALGEAVAHARHLEREGAIEIVPGAEPQTYRLRSA